MKRFYRQASVADGPEGAPQGFEVQLDGKGVTTPARLPLRLPTRALAEAIAEEWQAQDQDIRPATMPMMALACTVLDLVPKQRPAIIDQLAAYAGTDLVCYRVDQPADLVVAREVAAWQPLLDWAAQRHDAFLFTSTGLVPRPQPEAACRALAAAVGAHDDWGLAALQLAVTASGSIVVGLALIEGRLDPEQAFQASELHETFQIERWGEDAEATKRRAALRRDLEDARRFLALARGAVVP